jgi:hypothetical protein
MSYAGYDYPTKADESRVTAWQSEWINNDTFQVLAPWFDLVKSFWWMPEWGWTEFDGEDDGDPVRVYQISTGGWSGNEGLISAMRDNYLHWSLTFYQMRRGGHYEFRIPRLVESAMKVGAVDPSAADTGTPSTRD